MSFLRSLDASDLRDRLAASDPTGERLRAGLRAVLGAGLGAWVLSWLGARAGVPASAWLPGVELAMASAVLVPEGPLSAQRQASRWLPLVAVVAAALGAFADMLPELGAAAVTLAVVFGAVWSRRFGLAAAGAGTCAFLTYFVVRYFGIGPAQLPATAAALVAGAAIAHAARFWIVRERQERALPRTVIAFRLTVAIVLRRLRVLLEGRRRRGTARRLTGLVDRLHEAALALDERVARLPGPALPSGLPIQELREGIFEVQLAAERVVAAVGQAVTSRALPPGARRAVAAALDAARATVRREPARREGEVGEQLQLAAALARVEGVPLQARADVARLTTSLTDLERSGRWLRSAVQERLLPAVALGRAPALPPGPLGLAHPTRLAIQATLAAALAMFVGQQLSATRWWWAVIASFVVFNRATTAADTVQRAWLRVLGTVLGAVSGLLLGAAVAGHPRLELATVLACVFLAYWLFRLSYAWMLFWFTTLLAVLYRMLGRFSPEVMVLRVEETVIGASLGAVIAALVLPFRARTRVREGTAEVLRGVARWVDEAVVARASGDGEAVDASLAEARAMEDRLRALRATASPLVGSAIRSPRAARLLHGATAAVLFARHLAPGAALAQLGPEGRAEVAEAGRRLAAGARRTAALMDGQEGPGESPPPAAEPIARARATLRGEAAVRRGPASPPVWLHWLERLDEALRDLDDAVARAG